ncbi:hypothetical protein VNO78_19495 [Psophocarpus tetragonolobus]|uniref:Uncharacterized protein n=1 Tax=Psophocarpus tetragonolobus TaxID=3891 RepID=A0AAN9XGN7_PSOTE
MIGNVGVVNRSIDVGGTTTRHINTSSYTKGENGSFPSLISYDPSTLDAKSGYNRLFINLITVVEPSGEIRHSTMIEWQSAPEQCIDVLSIKVNLCLLNWSWTLGNSLERNLSHSNQAAGGKSSSESCTFGLLELALDLGYLVSTEVSQITDLERGEEVVLVEESSFRIFFNLFLLFTY